MKNIWKYAVLLGIMLMVVNILILICLMPFYGWKEALPNYVEVLVKTWSMLLFLGGFLGLVTHYKMIIGEIKEMLD